MQLRKQKMAKVNQYEKQAELQRVAPKVRTPKVHNANSLTPSRVGKVGTTLHFDVDTHRMLRELALDEGKSVTALLKEGVNLMLHNYGRKPIA